MPWYDHRLTDEHALRTIIPPSGISADKVLDHLDAHCRRFIAHSTFVLIGTWDSCGRADVSPKGDPPGFIQVIDDRTLAIPDRPGNGRIDTFTNVVQRPSIGLILLVPGILETCRISGRGSVSNDPELLDTMVVAGKRPKLALIVEVDEALVHCGKAIRRSGLWSGEYTIARDTFPTMGQMLHDQAQPEGLDREELSAIADDDLHHNMY